MLCIMDILLNTVKLHPGCANHGHVRVSDNRWTRVSHIITYDHAMIKNFVLNFQFFNISKLASLGALSPRCIFEYAQLNLVQVRNCSGHLVLIEVSINHLLEISQQLDDLL